MADSTSETRLLNRMRLLIGLITLGVLLVIANTDQKTWAQGALEPLPEIDFSTWAPSQYLNQYETANYIAEEWKKLGFSVKVNALVYPNPFLTKWFEQHDFHAFLTFWSSLPDRMEPDFFTNTKFHSSNMKSGGWNTGEYTNANFDRLAEIQLKTYDPEKRKQTIYELQQILYEDVPELVVATAVSIFPLNTERFDIDYVDATDGLRALWNYPALFPKGKEQIFKIGRASNPRTWNPTAVVDSTDLMWLRLIYDRVVQVGPQGEVKMWAATSVKMINDTTVETKIREDLKFHDGVPLSGEDVKFSFDYLKKWKAPYFAKYLDPIQEIEQVDKYTLRFHLKSPNAPFIMNTLGQVFILPKHIWNDIPEKINLQKPQDYPNVPPIGSGMFKFDYWKEGQEYRFSRNSGHFMRPKIETLLVIIFGSGETQFAALKKRDIDMTWEPILDIKAKELQKLNNFRLFNAEGVGYSGVQFHCGKPPFNDNKLRQALAHAIPYEKIIDEVFLGNAGKSASLILPSNRFWHNGNLKVRDFDLQKAKKMLEEAGYRWDDKGRICYPKSPK